MEEKMRNCPNCKSNNYAIIVRGFDMDHLIEKLLKEKKIIFGEKLDIDKKLQWHCNDCQTPWGKLDDK
jgi:Zn finger protein HypA/HybF involved in hydrogenase expression